MRYDSSIMNVPLPIEFIVGLIAGVLSIAVVVLVLQLRSQKQFERLSQPAYEYMLHAAEREVQEKLQVAEQQAVDVVAAAETERAQLVQQYREDFTALQQTYKHELSSVVEEQRTTFAAVQSEHVAQLKDQTKATLAEFRTNVEPLLTEVAELKSAVTDTRVSLTDTANAAETTLTKATTQAIDTMTSALDAQQATVKTELETHSKQALAAVDDAVTTYRKQREHIVDTHITQIVEAVAKRVLHTELTVHEHAELAKQALQRAKRDGTLS